MSGAICQKFVRPTYDDRREILTGSSRLCLKGWKKVQAVQNVRTVQCAPTIAHRKRPAGAAQTGFFFTTDTTRRRLSCLGDLDVGNFHLESWESCPPADRYGGCTLKDLTPLRPTLLWLQLLHVFFGPDWFLTGRAFFVCKLRPRPGWFSSSDITLYRYRRHVLFQRNC